MKAFPGAADRIKADDSDIHLFLVGDSTGESYQEWVGYFTDRLAAANPAYTVQYEEYYNGGSLDWGLSTTVQTGTGSNTITVWNAGDGGADASYFTDREIAVIQEPSAVDFIVVALGHNGNTAAEWNALIEMLQSNWPSAYITITKQNPPTAAAPYTGQYWDSSTRAAADRYGLPVLDIERIFVATGDVESYLADSVHPNDAGRGLWGAAAYRSLAAGGGSMSSILDRAEALLQAENYGGSGDWLDESGNGHNATNSGALFKAHAGTNYTYLPGTTSNYMSTTDVNLLSADNAHGEQSAGDWSTAGSNTITTATATAESIAHPMDTVLPGAGFTKVWKVTYQDDTDLASLAMTLTAAAHSFSVYVYLPTGWDGGNITIDDGGTFASETSVTSQGATGSTVDEWQEVWRKFTPAGGDLTGTLTLTAAGTPTAGKVIYLASACVRTGTTASFVPSLRIVGDLDVVFKTALNDWTPGTINSFVSTLAGSAVVGFLVRVTSNGNIDCYYGDGTFRNAYSVATTLTDGTAHEIRMMWELGVGVTFTLDGAALATFADNTDASPGTPSGLALRVGSWEGDIGATPLDGDVYWVEVRDGIGGPVAARYDAGDAAEPFATQTGATDGRTWTYNRSATGFVSTVVDRDMFLLTTDDYFETADDAALDFAETEPSTLMALVRTNTVAAGQDVAVAKKNDLTTAAGYALGRTTAASQFIIADGTADDDDTTGTMVTHTLYTLAGVRNITADNITAFLSGVASGSPTTDSTTATLANALPLRIGATSGTAANFWEGQIVAVALWREALTPGQILIAEDRLLGAPNQAETLHGDGLKNWILNNEDSSLFTAGSEVDEILNELNGTSGIGYAAARGTYLGIPAAG